MNKIKSIKRYQIGKVYRRDQPSASQNRYREFYQCDFDIAGLYDSMIPDSECIKIISDILNGLEVGEFQIKINHRSLLDGMFQIAGVPDDKIRTVSSSIDKLDKISWDEIKTELIESKGIAKEVVDKIGKYVNCTGDINTIIALKNNAELMSNTLAKTGLQELEILFKFCEIYGISNKVRI